MPLSDYPEWEETIRGLAGRGGRVLLLGPTDAGKTTFCRLLVNEALAVGRTVAVVDGDVGQSEIGPPACVGMGFAEKEIHALAEIPPAGLRFIGATSPRGAAVELASAMRVLADQAGERAPDLLIMDTTGMVRGAAAVRLKQAKIALLAPTDLVVLQPGRECEPILTPLKFTEGVRVHRPGIAKVIARKSSAMRSQRRAMRFARYFHESVTHTYDFDALAFTGTWLNGGPPMPAHHRKFMADALGLRVYYAEFESRHLGLLTSGYPAREQALSVLQEQFRPQEITVTPAAKVRHLLAGLADANDRLLGLGLIEALDVQRRQIGILTPIRARAAVKVVHFGLLRLQPDGKELGANRVGET
jgi:polynucleotide 5'-hydroxyl-kinase GRC3/NOL9